MQVEKKVAVFVANGDKLWTQGMCKGLQWEVQGFIQHTDFFVLPLMGCDIVLDIQWLKQLGLILWNFSTLVMQFTWDQETVVLQGLVAGEVKVDT